MINFKQLLSHINLSVFCATTVIGGSMVGVPNVAFAQNSGGPPGIFQPTEGCSNQQIDLYYALDNLSSSDFYNIYGAHKPLAEEGTNVAIDHNFSDDGNCSYLGGYNIHTWDTTVIAAEGSAIEIEDEGGFNKFFNDDSDPERNNNSNDMESTRRDRDYVIRLSQETRDNINKGAIAYNSIEPIYNRLDRLEDDYRASTAGIAAMTNIPQVTRAGANLIGVGVGHFKGESAIAVGFSTTSDNEAFVFKLSAGANTQNTLNVGTSIGYQW